MTDDMPEVDPRLIRLATGLLERTKSGIIDWEPLTRGSAFTYSATSGAFVIDSVDNDGTFPFRFSVLNSDGAVVEAMLVVHSDPHAAIFAELHRLAGRHALQVDKTLDGLLTEIEEMPPW